MLPFDFSSKHILMQAFTINMIKYMYLIKLIANRFWL